MKKIWLNSYPEGIPETINPDQFASISQMFAHTVERYADRPAVNNLGTTLTYRELDEQSTAFAAYLQQKLKLKKGDRLAIMLPNLIQYMVALYGAFKAGLVIVNVNPLYTAEEVEHQLKDAKVDALLVLVNFADTVQKALPQLTLQHLILTEVGDAYPPLKAKLVNFAVKYLKRMVPKYDLPAAIHYQTMMKEGAELTLESVDLKGDDLAFLQYTGGTTGVPKGAMLSHRNMIANIEQAYSWMAPYVEIGHEVVVTPLPLYHIFSLLANCLVFARAGALNLLITNPRDMKGFVKTLRKNRFTCMTGVNTLFNALLNRPELNQVDFSNLKVVLGGGMAIQKAVAQKWYDRTGVPLLEAYGLTETSPAVTINPLTLKQYNGSIGLPIPSTNVKVIDDNDQELPLGESGELCIQGPQVMQGYWNIPKETEKVMLPNGWLRTGDIAKLDEEGFVYLVDRKKDLVVVSGFNVYPNEVEDVIAQHPDVVEVAVIGVPSKKTGEALKAFIVSNNENLNQEAIKQFCRKHLTAYKIPKRYEFRDELPKSSVGKILRKELRKS